MTEYIFQEETIRLLADAFRHKTNSTNKLSIEDMRSLIYLMHYNIANGVTFYSIDGEPLYSYSIEEAQTLAELPVAPKIKGHSFDRWSYTLSEINNTATALEITPIYSELVTQMMLETTSASEAVSFYAEKSSTTGDAVIDWGDGTETSTITTSNTKFTHTYADAGSYRIRISSDYAGIIIGSNNYSNKPTLPITEFIGAKNIVSVKQGAFDDCTSLASITIPDSVTSLDKAAFSGCTSLTSVTIPDSVTNIGNSAFSYCTSLTSVTIGNGVTRIGDNAFAYCTSLTSITIPDSVTSIGQWAFRNCTSLTNLTIPDNVTNVGTYLCEGCSRLEELNISANARFINTTGGLHGIVTGCSSLRQLTIPHIKNPDISQNNSSESLFVNLFGSTECVGCVEVQSYYASNRTMSRYVPVSLDTVTIHGGRIDYGAFQNCNMIQHIILGDDVTIIRDSGAFEGCNLLQTVTIGASVTRIGLTAFKNCTQLETVYISAGELSEIGNYIFLNNFNAINIIYSGTKAQWNAISKSADWNSIDAYHTKATLTITCSDGTI